MDINLVREVIECLPEDRSIFHYYKDKYAVYLLEQYLSKRKAQSIRQVRESKVGKLLNKPIVCDILKHAGKGELTSQHFAYFWPHETEKYVLTLGQWGNKQNYGWNQTSRPGSNLVLQLNYNGKFDRAFCKLLGLDANTFTARGHPISFKRNATLAWARLDLDFDTGEVLIEEIQSDLIRDLAMLYRFATTDCTYEELFDYGPKKPDPHQARRMCEEHFLGVKDIWAEAMMTSVLWFIHHELGFDKVYYHTFETGKVMKNLYRKFPSRSLYTDLPKKFCFEKTSEAPDFLQKNSKSRRRLKAAKTPEWYVLAS